MSKREKRVFGNRAAQGRTWAALTLLVLVVVIPAVTVGWLVFQASGNKRLAMVKIYEDARTGYLETGRGLVAEELEQVRARLEEWVPAIPSKERWSSILASGRVDGYVPESAIDGSMEGTRLMEPMNAYLAVETARNPQEAAEARSQFRAMILDPDVQARMPIGQILFALRRVSEWDDDPGVAFACRFARNSVAWMERSALLPEGESFMPVSRLGELIGFRVDGDSGIVILEEATLLEQVQMRLDALPERAGGRLFLRPAAEVPPSGSADREGVSGPVSVAAGYPLEDWAIAFEGDDGLAAIGRAQREVFWLASVGAFVIAVSAALSLALYRVMQRQAKLAQLKNDLVATVSHELKTPVASIRLLVDTLQNESKLEPTRVRDYLGLISRENRRLGHLIENFLSFSRMERDKNSFDLRPIEPETIVRAAERVFRDRQGEWKGELFVRIENDLPLIQADDEALQTALGNLLENAQKYAGQTPVVSMKARQSGDQVEFSVSDDGIGIAREDQKRIFEKFFQARTRLSEHAGGVGLGLSIVSFIVEKHGGTLRLESEPGQGSTFSILLPAQGPSVRRKGLSE